MKNYKHKRYVSFGYDQRGIRIRKWIYYNTEKQFLEQYSKIKTEMDSYRNPDNMSFGRYTSIFTDVYVNKLETASRQSWGAVLKKLEPLFCLPLKKITKTDIQSILNENIDHPYTCKRIKQFSIRIFESAIDDGYINFNPAKKLEVPKHIKKERRALSEQEKEAILNLTTLPKQEHLAMMLFYIFGLRPEELRAISRSSIDLKNKELNITQACVFDEFEKPYIKNTKNNVHRTLPIPDTLLPEIKEYLKSNKDFYLFSKNGHPLMTKSEWRGFDRRIRKEIIKYAAIHTHTECTAEYIATILHYLCGLRLEELPALKKTCIDLKTKTLVVNQKAYYKNTKMGFCKIQEKNIELSDFVLDKIKPYISNLIGDYLFSINGAPYTEKRIWKDFEKNFISFYNRITGLSVSKGFSLYTFRHNVGTQLYYTNGISSKKAAEFLGHQEEVFLRTYSHLDESKEKIEEYFKAINM